MPAGNYKGIITDTEMATRGLVEWKVQGTVESNEIIIHVAADGGGEDQKEPATNGTRIRE